MKSDKDLYRLLRSMPGEKLWKEEVARFDQADAKERNERVAVIRAVGVVFAATGTAAQRAEVKAWLVRLLKDPSEKVRRYAMAAIPKIRSVPGAEEQMISLLTPTTGEREKKYVGRALDKIGGPEALRAVSGLLPQTEQKVKAAVARAEKPSEVRLDRTFIPSERLLIHLRCRQGLEKLVRAEVEALVAKQGRFRVLAQQRCYVAITPTGPFSLSDLYQLRCFATIGFELGVAKPGNVEEIAGLVVSPLARKLMKAFTDGSLRYRLDFVAKGHQRGAVRQVANRAFAMCPEILNDPRIAPWSMDIHPTPRGTLVELRPRIYPDPRLGYRVGDLPASSHPPLAACMARLAGPGEGEVVWDPFCGSGLELIERALLGGVARIIGTDVSTEAIIKAKDNVAAAKLTGVESTFVLSDFRKFEAMEGLGPGTVSLIITNPPMGRRIRIQDMKGLYADFFAAAARALKPGGRLVFPNPLHQEPVDRTLKLEYRQSVDLGGYVCRLEMYRKALT